MDTEIETETDIDREIETEKETKTDTETVPDILWMEGTSIRFIRGSQAFSLLMMDYRADRKVRDFSGENHIGSVISSYHKMWLQLQLKLP